MKSGYTFIRQTIQDRCVNSAFKTLHKLRVYQWNKEESFVRIDRPTNLPTARRLGYKPKHGVILVRARVRKGSFHKSQLKAGRRPKRMGITKMTVHLSLQTIAEQRTVARYPNMEVLNSYFVGKTGRHEYYEVILLERGNTGIIYDSMLGPLSCIRGRVQRGLTGSKKPTNQ